LNNDMAAQQRMRLIGIPVQDRPNDGLVFRERSRKPAEKTKSRIGDASPPAMTKLAANLAAAVMLAAVIICWT
jgi:hypothetical protein